MAADSRNNRLNLENLDHVDMPCFYIYCLLLGAFVFPGALELVFELIRYR